MRSLLALVCGASLLAGCAVAPYDYYGGTYYGYGTPSYYGYYDYGPAYYYGPDYYSGVIVGPPVVAGGFTYRSGTRHWNGGTRQRSSVQAAPSSRSSTVVGTSSRGVRSANVNRGSTSKQAARARDREARRVAGRTTDHGA